MKTLFAIFVAICTAIWVYGSLRFYSCIRSQTCDYGFSSPNLEITIMLLGAFIFGYLFGNLLSGLRKRKYIKRSQLDDLKGSYTQSKKYGLYSNRKNIDVDNTNQEFNFDEELWSIDKSTNVDKNYSKNETKNVVDTSSDYNDNNQNSVSSKLPEDGELSVKKKSLFSSFLDDVNLSSETELSEEKREVDSKIDNLSSSKSVKYTSNDSSIKKVHQKNIQQKKSKDDLTKIEGIGPKIAELLNNNDIHTFIDLAKTDPFILSGILTSAGSRFQMHNPKTWPQQSVYAAKEEWDTLKKYQDKLNGGRA